MNFALPHAAQFTCSSCGAPLGVASKTSIYIVCPYCNTCQLRKGVSLESVGKVGTLKEDFSVIQIGTQGTYDLKKFAVCGRIRLQWERGTWDEWYIVFEDSSTGWLAEAQGFYYVSKPYVYDFSEVEFPLSIRRSLEIDGLRYKVKDRKYATCVYSEGELPFNGAEGEQYESYDLFTPDGRFLGISRVEGDTLAFRGGAYTFEELALYNLRILEGWGTHG